MARKRTATRTAAATDLVGSDEAPAETLRLYESLLDNIADGYAVVSHWKIRYVNERLLEMTGYSRDDLIGRSFMKVVPRRQRAVTRQQYREMISGNRPAPDPVEGWLLTKRGLEVPVEVAWRQTTIGGKSVTTVLLRDIGARRALQEERRALAEFQAGLLRDANVPIMAVDMTGRFTLFNRAAERITGYTAAEAPQDGTLWRKAFPDAVQRRRYYREAMDALGEGRDVIGFETPIRTKSGETRLISWSGAGLRDAEGRIVGGVGVGRDITDIRRAEAEAERRRQQVEALNKISHAMLAGESVDQAIDEIPRIVRRLVGADAVGLVLIEHPDAEPRLIFDGAVPRAVREFVRRRGFHEAPNFLRILRTGEPVSIGDMRRVRKRLPAFRDMLEAGWRSAVLVPATGRHSTVGVLAFASRIPDRFADDLDFLTTIGREVGFVVEHGLMDRELANRERRLEGVNAVSRALMVSGSLDEALAEIPAILCKQVGADAVSLYLTETRDAPWRFLFAGEIPGLVKKLNRQEGLSRATWNRRVFRTGKPVVVRDMRRVARRPTVEACLKAGLRSVVIVPVAGREGVIGTLAFLSKTPNHFGREVETLTTFGREIGLVLEHGLLVKELASRQRQLEAVNEVSRALMLSDDLDEGLARVPDILCTRIEADAVTLFLAATPDAPWRFLFSGSVPPLVQKINREAGLAKATSNRRVFRTGKPVVVRDFRRLAKRPIIEACLEAGLRSGVIVPVAGRHEVLGTLGFNSKEPDHFTQDVEFLTRFGREIGLVVEHGLLVRQLETRQRRIEALNAVTQAIVRAERVEEGLAQVPRILRELAGFEGGLLFVPAGLTDRPLVVTDGAVPGSVRRGLQEPGLPKARLTSRVLRTGRPLRIDDLRRPGMRIPHRKELLRLGYLSIVLVPMVGRDRTVGTLEFNSRRAACFTDADTDILTAVGEEVGRIIEHRLLEEQLARSERRLEALNTVARTIMLAGDIEKALDQVPGILRGLVGAEGVALLVAEPQHLRRLVTDGEVPDFAQRVVNQPGLTRAPWHKQVLETREPLVIPDLRQQRRTQVVREILKAGQRSLVIVPVAGRRGIMGTLAFGSKTLNYFTEDVPVLTAIGHEVCLMIEHGLLVGELARRERRLEALNAITREVILSERPERGLRQVPRILRKLVGADAACLFVATHPETEPRAIFDGRIPPAIRAAMRTPGAPAAVWTAEVMRTGKPMVISDLRQSTCAAQSIDDMDAYGLRSFVSVPVVCRRGVVGTLEFAARSPGFFTEDDVSFLTAVGREVGLVIEHRLLEEQVHDREQRLEAMAARLTQTAEEERHHIAALLHDDLGQRLSLARIQADLAARHLSEPNRAGADLREVSAGIGEVLTGMRGLAGRLEPQILSDFDLVSALRKTLRDLDATRGEDIRFAARGTGRRLEPELERVLFRIAMEATENAIKHARTRTIRVTVTQRSDRLTLSIRDDGRGFDAKRLRPRGGGLGLRLMRDRARSIGATVTVKSARGKGTTVRIVVPLGGERREH